MVTSLLKLVLDIETLIEEKSDLSDIEKLNGQSASQEGFEISEFSGVPVKSDFDSE